MGRKLRILRRPSLFFCDWLKVLLFYSLWAAAALRLVSPHTNTQSSHARAGTPSPSLPDRRQTPTRARTATAALRLVSPQTIQTVHTQCIPGDRLFSGRSTTADNRAFRLAGCPPFGSRGGQGRNTIRLSRCGTAAPRRAAPCMHTLRPHGGLLAASTCQNLSATHRPYALWS